MQRDTQIQQIFRLLTESGLDKERIIYWLNRFKNDQFTDADGAILTQELRDHLRNLDESIEETGKNILQKKAAVKNLETSAMPFLEKIAAHQQREYEAEQAEYKNTVLGAEKTMSQEIESIRNTKTTDEIAALRKKLKT